MFVTFEYFCILHSAQFCSGDIETCILKVYSCDRTLSERIKLDALDAPLLYQSICTMIEERIRLEPVNWHVAEYSSGQIVYIK